MRANVTQSSNIPIITAGFQKSEIHQRIFLTKNPKLKCTFNCPARDRLVFRDLLNIKPVITMSRPASAYNTHTVFYQI